MGDAVLETERSRVEMDPRSVFEQVMPRHESLPVDERPVLVFRHPTARDYRGIKRAYLRLQAVAKDTTDEEAEAAFEDALKAVQSVLVYWDNQVDELGHPLAFEASDLDRVVDDLEVGMLLGVLYSRPLLAAAEKKTSASPSASGSGPSEPGKTPAVSPTDGAATGAADGSSSSAPSVEDLGSDG